MDLLSKFYLLLVDVQRIILFSFNLYRIFFQSSIIVLFFVIPF